MKNLAIPLVYFAGIISAIGALIHFAAIAGGTGWYIFLGRLPRLALPRLMLAGMAGVCLLRAAVIVPLAINHPQLRTTFELISAVIWGLAGAGFLVACLTPVRQRQPLARTPLGTIT